jgi:hypothetical protein
MQQAIASQQAASLAVAGEAKAAELDANSRAAAMILTFIAKSPYENV